MAYKHLYLPIEESVRELKARLLLVIGALSKGYRIVIGQQWLMMHNTRNLVPGVMFFKGTNRIQKDWIAIARHRGHKIVAIDEEVTAMATERFVLQGVKNDFFDAIDRFFIQGQHQYDIYSKAFPEQLDRFVITGNPRFDLLREHFTGGFQREADQLRAKFGRYILINTNFGAYNTAWGSFEKFVAVCKNIGYADWDDPDDRAWFDGTYELEKENMAHFEALARALRDRFPEHRIILRPHPSEDLAVWQRRLAGEDRIHVVFEGSAVPWIFGSEFFVHNTCTTGTEAMILGVPVAAYAPFTNWVETIFLANLVTPVYRDLETLFDAAEAAIADRAGAVAKIKSDHSDILSRHISGLGQSSATGVVLKAIESIEQTPVDGPIVRDGHKILKHVKRTDYQKKKIDLSVRDMINEFASMAAATGHSFDAKVEPIGDSLFAITPRSNKET